VHERVCVCVCVGGWWESTLFINADVLAAFQEGTPMAWLGLMPTGKHQRSLSSHSWYHTHTSTTRAQNTYTWPSDSQIKWVFLENTAWISSWGIKCYLIISSPERAHDTA